MAAACRTVSSASPNAVFNDATARAEAGIPKLKRASEEASSTLLERVEKAQSLRDDLAFMIERADAMAGRLEGTVRAARSETKPSPAPAAGRPSMVRSAPPAPSAPAASPAMSDRLGDAGDDERSEAERELLRALQAVR